MQNNLAHNVGLGGGGDAGGVIGTGANNQIAFWTGMQTQSGSNNFTWNNSTSAFSLTGTSLFNIAPNTASPFQIKETGVGTPNYFQIVTTTAAQAINFGNATDNPAYNFLGTGTTTHNGNISFNSNKHIIFSTSGSGSAITSTNCEMGVDNTGSLQINMLNGSSFLHNFNGTNVVTFQQVGAFSLTPSARQGGGNGFIFNGTGAAHGSVTGWSPPSSGTLSQDFYLNLVRTVTFNSSISPKANQFACQIDAGVTYAYNAAGSITLAAALGINGIPIQGANNTLTTTAGLAILTNNVSTAGTGTGLYVQAPSGASSNFSAMFMGNVQVFDSTNTGGATLIPSSFGNFTIQTNTAAGQLRLQVGTYTYGSNSSAIISNPTFGSENFNHNTLNLTPTQNGTNTAALRGAFIQLTKATGATTLAEMDGINIGAPVITGTVTSSYAIKIGDQTNANITNNPNAINLVLGSANCISFGSPIMYGTSADTLSLFDHTNTRGINFGMSAAGNQSISATGGNLAFTVPSGSMIAAVVNSVTIANAAANEFIQNVGQKVNVTTSAAGAYVILLTDFIIAKTGITGGGDTVTLPSAVTAGSGKLYRIKDQSGTAGTNNITVNATAGNIDGAASKVMNTNYQSLDFYSDGTNWFIV